MANTNILIKRSNTTRTPVSLDAGEFAYSYASDTLFLGNSAGTGVINIGGLLYTQTIDAATSANTGSTLVKRDADGKFAGRLTGIADKADQLTNSRNFSISGHDITASAVSFDGTGAVVLDASLNQVPGLTAGTYGSTTEIPSVTVGANGRILAITTNSVATNLDIAGDTGTDAIDLLTDTLTFTGGSGITSAVGTNSVTFNVDDTVVRSNTPITLQTIDGGLAINGNLTVLGIQTTVNTQTLNIADPLLYLAANNYSSDVVDIGYVGNYFDGSTQRHAGVFRNAGDKHFYIFDNYDKEPESNDIDVADASFRLATVHANLVSTVATVGTLTLTNALTVPNGGTGQTSFTTGRMLVGSGVNGLATIANTSVATEQSFGSASSVPVFETDAWGRVSAVTNTSIAIAASAITSGTLPIARGGTNGTSFTDNQITYFDGTKIASLANVSYTLTGSLSASKTITSITVDNYGRVTAATGSDINIDASQIGSGTLGYSRGGTGSTSYTTGGIVIAGPTGLESLANTTYTQTGSLTSNNTITSITVDAYGRFTAATTGAISGLTVAQGGTGLSTITQSGITYGNGTGSLGVTAAAGTSDQSFSNQLLTVNNSGVPVWTTTLDGGQF